MTLQTRAAAPQLDSHVEAHRPADGVSELVAALKSGLAELTTADAEGTAGRSRMCAAARELEVRARHLAQLLEDHVVPLPLRLEPLSTSGTTEQPAGRFEVLVVDDEPDQLALLRRILSPWFSVRVARDGLEALEQLRARTPDVVLTDLQMPNVDGLALLELSRTTAEALNVPLIVLSGRGDTQTKVMAFESGAFDFMTRPVAPNELVARIRNALAHSQVLRRERQLGARDDLTGLANRRSFRTFLETALRNARLRGAPLALLMVDQDRLKQLNDTWGHPVGDEALRTLARALAHSTRGSDCAARVGGDEFAVVVPGCDREGALILLHRVEESLRRNPITLPDGSQLFVEASFGIAALGESGEETAEQLLRRADLDLYEHKRARKRAG